MIEPTISIVVLSFNTSELTVDCLKSILLDKGLKEIPYEIIVIDNNSQDDSVSQIKKIKGPIKLVENKVNLGFGKTNNQALKTTIIGNRNRLKNKLDYLYSNDSDKVFKKVLLNTNPIQVVNPNSGPIRAKPIR